LILRLLVSVFTNSEGICEMVADSRRYDFVATAVATQLLFFLLRQSPGTIMKIEPFYSSI